MPPPARLLESMKGEADSRGFLATHVAFRDESGAPMLQRVDNEKAALCMAERRCQTCGFAFDPESLLIFVGTHSDSLFKEPPIHLECAVYSLNTCPALLRGSRQGRILILVATDYVYEPATLVGPALCRPTSANDDRDDDFQPMELTVDELYEVYVQSQPAGSLD